MNPMQQQSPQNVIYQQYTSPPNAATSAQNQHQQQMLNSGMQQQRVVYAVNPPQQSPVRTVVGGSTVGAPTPVAPMQPRSIQPNTRQDTAGGSGDASTGVGAGRLTDKATLDAIVRDLDPHIQMDDDIKELLLDMADDFIEQLIDGATDVAAARGGTQLRADDVNFVLERQMGMWLPGMGAAAGTVGEGARASAVGALLPTDTHNARMASIKKTLKKP